MQTPAMTVAHETVRCVPIRRRIETRTAKSSASIIASSALRAVSESAVEAKMAAMRRTGTATSAMRKASFGAREVRRANRSVTPRRTTASTRWSPVSDSPAIQSVLRRMSRSNSP